MKCPECGAVHNNMYKEMRQMISEMGITKEDVQAAIYQTLESMIKSIMSEEVMRRAITEAVQSSVGRSLQYNTDSRKMVETAIRDAVLEALLKNFEISIGPKTGD